MADMSSVLPWHLTQWQQLDDQRRASRLPHALLFTGIKGNGKTEFAREFARSLLCTATQMDGSACGQCRSCLLFAAGSHPDYVNVLPEEEGKAIKVDQIRELIDFYALSAQYSGYKIVILSPADAMNRNAANSLLKTLEEPPANAVLILVTEQPGHLPATIRSRCHELKFHIPTHDMAMSWLSGQIKADQGDTYLEMANGAPLAALKLAESGEILRKEQQFTGFYDIANGRQEPVKLASEWLKDGVKQPLQWVSTWIMDIIRLKMASEPPRLNNPDIRPRLQHFANNLNLTGLYAFYEQVTDAIRLTGTQANEQMLLEGILIEWKRLQEKNK